MASDKHLKGISYRMDVDNIPDLNHVPADISPENLDFLRGLINSFNNSTIQLKESYDALQEKVENLNLRLEEANGDLSESLTEQERLSNYLTNILESLSSGVLVIDTEGIITLFNKGAEEITGIKGGEAINKPYSEIMGSDVPVEHTPLSRLSSGEWNFQFEKIITSGDGRIIPVGCSISPLMNTSGERIGAVEIFMDLTRIKTLEDELSHKEKLAVLGQMAATMAHKIRNPLGGITGFAGLLQLELQDNENGKRMVGRIIEGIDKLNRIITSLLSYASPLKLKPHKVDLAMLTGDIIQIISEKNSKVQFNLEQPDGAAVVEVDAGQFTKAVFDIILNACETLEGCGVVHIVIIPGTSDYRPSDSLTVRLLDEIRNSSSLMSSLIPSSILLITDFGQGMSSMVREQLFVPFYTTKENGIGLGLASTRKIIEAHHGEIWIESEENCGTAVGIVLPVRRMDFSV